MGLNSCICMRNFDELSRETALNGDGEIEGFIFPNTNNPNVSSTEYSSKLKGAGRMSYLMKVNSIDSGILRSNAYYNLKGTSAAEKIQSIFRGFKFRKYFYKNNEKSGKNNNRNKEKKVKIISVEEKQNEHNKFNDFMINKDEKNRNRGKSEKIMHKHLKLNNNEVQNFSIEFDEKKANNEKIIINNMKENDELFNERNNNDDSNDDESNEKDNNSSSKRKNFSSGNYLKSNKINHKSVKMNYVNTGSNNLSEENSLKEENDSNKKIDNKEMDFSSSSLKKLNDSMTSEKISNKSSIKEIKEEIINTDIKPVNNKIFNEDKNNFIKEKTKIAEKNFEREIDYGKDWKKYLDDDINSNDSETTFFQARLNDEVKNSKNLVSTDQTGELFNINNEICLFIGQYDNCTKPNSNFILKGKGSLYYKNGVKYEGIFIENELNGIGRYINEEGICYEGIFKNGILKGKGKQITVDEDGNKIIYKGSLNNLKKDGKGILETKTFKYEGNFKNDKKNGKGLIIYKDNGNIYQGDFLDDNITGYGIYTFKNKQSYEGQVVNGVFHGKGTYNWTDGTYFKGTYVNGSREGFGEYKFSNGKIFDGPFQKGKPHGKGKLIIKGKYYDCEFKYGKLVTDIKTFISARKSSKG